MCCCNGLCPQAELDRSVDVVGPYEERPRREHARRAHALRLIGDEPLRLRHGALRFGEQASTEKVDVSSRSLRLFLGRSCFLTIRNRLLDDGIASTWSSAR
jgi:hypothetical protein